MIPGGQPGQMPRKPTASHFTTEEPVILGTVRAARAEDRATRGRDPSADPGAKTGGGAGCPHPRLRDWQECDKSNQISRSHWLAYGAGLILHFTLNQHSFLERFPCRRGGCLARGAPERFGGYSANRSPTEAVPTATGAANGR